MLTRPSGVKVSAYRQPPPKVIKMIWRPGRLFLFSRAAASAHGGRMRGAIVSPAARRNSRLVICCSPLRVVHAAPAPPGPCLAGRGDHTLSPDGSGAGDLWD